MEKRKITLTESDIAEIIKETVKAVRLDEELTRGQVRDEIEDYTKTKDFDKRVHNIVVDVFNELVQNMWSKKSFWSTMLRKK